MKRFRKKNSSYEKIFTLLDNQIYDSLKVVKMDEMGIQSLTKGDKIILVGSHSGVHYAQKAIVDSYDNESKFITLMDSEFSKPYKKFVGITLTNFNAKTRNFIVSQEHFVL